MKKRVALSIVFGVVYYLCVFIGATYSAGSTWEAGSGNGLFFGTFWFLISYPVLLGIQAGLAYLFRRVRKIHEKRVSAWEFLPCVLLSALFLSTAIPQSPESQFRRFVADRVPPSVSNIKCWHRGTFSGRQWVVSFSMAPEDLEAVLSRNRYEKQDLSPGQMLEIPGGVIETPKEPMAYCYSYSAPPSERPRWMKVYVNHERTRAYVIGGRD